MKQSDFKWFKERVSNAENEDDVIFHGAYLWFDLTDRQVQKIIPIFKEKGAVRVEFPDGRIGWEYSWITLFENGDNVI